MNAKEVFIKHWRKVTKLPCDDAVMAHMQYCLDAMEEYAEIKAKTCNTPQVSNSVCGAGERYSECHIHSDNMEGCIGCGNLKQIDC